MKDLYSYIKPKKQIIDAHSHLFDHTGALSKLYSVPKFVNKIVGFADICFNAIDKYTEGKILGAFILAAVEYERAYLPLASEEPIGCKCLKVSLQ